MKSLHKLALALALAVVGVIQPLSSASAQATQQFYYLGEWQWVDFGPGGAWDLPYQGVTGRFDLRGPTRSSVLGKAFGERMCCALLATDRPLNTTGDGSLTLLGNKNSQAPTSALIVRLGVPVDGRTTQEAIHNLLTRQGDPTGELRWKPPLPDNKGRIRIRLGDGDFFSTEYARASAPGRPADPLWPVVREVLRADYARVRAASVGRGSDHHLKWLDYHREKYKVDYRELLGNQPDEGLRPHETTVTDDFNRADSSTIGPYTENGDFEIISNQLGFVTAAGDGRSSAVHTTNLSGDDHYSQAVITIPDAFTNALIGVLVRYQDANNWYGCFNGDFTVDEIFIIKRVGGATTLMSSLEENGHNGETVKMEVDSSSLTCTIDGAPAASDTDTDLTGQTLVGMMGTQAGGGPARWDDFLAEDLGAVAAPRRIMVIAGG